MLVLVFAGLACCAGAQLVSYPNGAVVPLDPANQAATAAHLASKGLGYGYGHPYAGLGHLYGRKKREADAQLVSYPNGAVVPLDPANQAATSAHLASKGLAYGYGYPYAGLGYLYGRKKREADAQLVTYPNGAVVPYDGANQAATAAHLASKGLGYGYGYGYPYSGLGYLYGRKRREAEADSDAQYLYAGLPYGYPYAYGYTPLVAHPNGAVVPLEPAAVVQARADHLAAKAVIG